MTERIKDRLTGWLVTLLFVLLGWIAGGVAWLVTQNVYKDQEQDKYILQNESNTAKVARTVSRDPDTRLEDKDELRPIYFNARSGN